MTLSNIDMDRALADFAEYERWGGLYTFDSWLDRYQDTYKIGDSETSARLTDADLDAAQIRFQHTVAARLLQVYIEAVQKLTPDVDPDPPAVGSVEAVIASTIGGVAAVAAEFGRTPYGGFVTGWTANLLRDLESYGYRIVPIIPPVAEDVES